jgi:hypothetical protein
VSEIAITLGLGVVGLLVLALAIFWLLEFCTEQAWAWAVAFLAMCGALVWFIGDWIRSW